ncbi:MAG: ABC transporter ATP-binding protein [Prevotellaceae bacterium]|nr:ABC transporter ATP-binding protein [Prevotellaceae bacterium]
MSRKVIEFDGVGKQYVLGTFGTGTLSHDLNRWWASIRGKEDPYLKVGEVNDRTQKGDSRFVWALKDISFSVEQGDVVGIIGKNGAGKSTLLKILSRVTSPTIGSIKVKGRIASLLEVGTGFHPEMTGRENIYMNGSIMGMTRAEITRKLDEIVDFAGVEKYLDTPVKRYSSGMIVRLGFAIAAHLDPEILVVDEVLAVGDAEFQKKAIGKMHDVANGEGRTVLFVSHNMAAVKSLCKNGVVMQNGQVAFKGNIDDSLKFYLNNETQINSDAKIMSHITKLKPTIIINNILINGTDNYSSTVFSGQDTLNVKVIGNTSETMHADLMVFFRTKDHVTMATLAEGHCKGKIEHYSPGDFTIEKNIKLPKYLSCGDYYLSLCLHHPMVEGLMDAVDCALIHIEGYQEGFGRTLQLNTEGFMGLETNN